MSMCVKFVSIVHGVGERARWVSHKYHTRTVKSVFVFSLALVYFAIQLIFMGNNSRACKLKTYNSAGDTLFYFHVMSLNTFHLYMINIQNEFFALIRAIVIK